MARIHIIGAGLAGLAAAIDLADKGAQIVIHEGANEAGGRARSFHDKTLDTVIDNGNHLMLSGNHCTLDYLNLVNASGRLTGPDKAAFDFADLETGERWTINFNRGPVPLWVMYEKSRVPGTSMMDYVSGLKLLTAGNRTVANLFAGQGQIYRRFWEPFSVAVLNTSADVAVARLLVPVIRETLSKGADYCRPLVAKRGLSDTFVSPALKFLERRKADIRFGQRITEIKTENGKATALKTSRHTEPLAGDDTVIVATPPWATERLLPDTPTPNQFAPIVNVHFRVDGFDADKCDHPMLGLIGSPAHWLFARGDVISVTVSAASDLAELPASEVVARIWPDVARAHGLEAKGTPPARVIKEQRATFIASADQLARRPDTKTEIRNLVLAGDWINTGLPATIEGAIRSGQKAARAVLQ